MFRQNNRANRNKWAIPFTVYKMFRYGMLLLSCVWILHLFSVVYSGRRFYISGTISESQDIKEQFLLNITEQKEYQRTQEYLKNRPIVSDWRTASQTGSRFTLKDIEFLLKEKQKEYQRKLEEYERRKKELEKIELLLNITEEIYQRRKKEATLSLLPEEYYLRLKKSLEDFKEKFEWRPKELIKKEPLLEKNASNTLPHGKDDGVNKKKAEEYFLRVKKFLEDSEENFEWRPKELIMKEPLLEKNASNTLPHGKDDGVNKSDEKGELTKKKANIQSELDQSKLSDGIFHVNKIEEKGALIKIKANIQTETCQSNLNDGASIFSDENVIPQLVHDNYSFSVENGIAQHVLGKFSGMKPTEAKKENKPDQSNSDDEDHSFSNENGPLQHVGDNYGFHDEDEEGILQHVSEYIREKSTEEEKDTCHKEL